MAGADRLLVGSVNAGTGVSSLLVFDLTLRKVVEVYELSDLPAGGQSLSMLSSFTRLLPVDQQPAIDPKELRSATAVLPNEKISYDSILERVGLPSVQPILLKPRPCALSHVSSCGRLPKCLTIGLCNTHIVSQVKIVASGAGIQDLALADNGVVYVATNDTVYKYQLPSSSTVRATNVSTSGSSASGRRNSTLQSSKYFKPTEGASTITSISLDSEVAFSS